MDELAHNLVKCQQLADRLLFVSYVDLWKTRHSEWYNYRADWQMAQKVPNAFAEEKRRYPQRKAKILFLAGHRLELIVLALRPGWLTMLN